MFRGSFPRADVSLDPPLPEVAFVGRANAGKSSLLNALAGVRLAKVSGTPGKTRMMNVFSVSGASGVGRGPWAAEGFTLNAERRTPNPLREGGDERIRESSLLYAF